MNKGMILNIPRRFVESEWGGTETVIAETSKNLISLGYQAEVVTTQALSNESQDTICNIPVKRFPYSYTRLGLNKKKKLLLDKRGGNMYSIKMLIHVLFAQNIKVLHLHTMGRLGAVIQKVAKLRNIPYVVSIHGGLFDLPKKQLEELTAPTKNSFNWGKPFDLIFNSTHLIKNAAAVICVGEKERTKVAFQYPDKKVFFLPNGVDIDKFSQGNRARFIRSTPLEHTDRIVLCVSGFYSQKNQLTLISAFAQCSESIDDLKLVLVGVIYDSDYFVQIKELIQTLEIEDRVIILSNLKFDNPMLADAYSAAELFVLPSHYETFGVVILEAWASGTPTICGNVGGLPSFVKDGENGIFFDTRSADDLSVKMQKALSPPHFCKDIQKGARQSVQQYSWSKITKNLARIYEEVSN